jgi:microcystin-dependent protein
MDPFLGEVVMFGGNFAPRGWAFCHGQLLAISSNSALFSILGTIYGGDGRTTFALPDLRGRVAMQQGNGPGLSSRPLGQRSGTETNTHNITNLPPHNHGVTVPVSTGAPEENAGYLGSSGIFTEDATSGASYPGVVAGMTGGQQSVNNMQPYLAVNYIIATQGVYPSRN